MILVHNGGATSRAAAESMEGCAKNLRARVLAYIQRCGAGGATREQIEEALEMSGNTARPRVRELMKEGKIQTSLFTCKTKSGREAEVLVATGL